jgi:hypothetical protein
MSAITKTSSSLGFKQTLTPPCLCSYCVHVLPMSLCAWSFVFVNAFMCYLGPRPSKFCSPYLLYVCKGGSVVVETRAPLPKLLQA